jgi:hypothetical protein
MAEDQANPFAQFVKPATKAPVNEMVIEQAMSQPVNDDLPGPDQFPSDANPFQKLVPTGADKAFKRGADFSGAPREESSPAIDVTMEDLNEALMSIPGVPSLAEFAQRFNMNVADTIDFFGPDIINGALVLAGSDKRVPTAREAAETFQNLEAFGGPGGTGEQQFLPEGTQREAMINAADFAQLAGGFSALMKKLPSMLPDAQQVEGAKKVGVGIADQLGKASNLALDTIYGAAGGIGETYGEEFGGAMGGFTGSLVAPLALGAADVGVIRPMLKEGKEAFNRGINETRQIVDRFNTEEASKLIARQLYNEGITPEQALKMYDDLGPDAVLADLGGSWRALLEQSATVYPRIFTAAQRQFAERMKRQPERIMKAFDDISGTSMLDADAEVERLAAVFEPAINSLYNVTREQNLRLSDGMRKLFETSPTLKKAGAKAEVTLADMRATGKKVSTIDYVDQTKRVLDDEINSLVQKGARTNEIANKTQLKNTLVAEADASIPEYKQAREQFANLQELRNAVAVGRDIFRLSESPGDFKTIIDGMNPAEKRMAVLGMKDAMIRKFNEGAETANSVNQMFKRRGTLEKARVLFPDDASFNQFKEAMRREMEYVATPNQVVGGSATARRSMQAMIGQKDESMLKLLDNLNKNKTWYKQWIFDKVLALYKSGNPPEKMDALETAGDLLMLEGMEPERVAKILNSEDPFRVQEILLESLKYYDKPISPMSPKAMGIFTGQAGEEFTGGAVSEAGEPVPVPQ